MKVLLINTYSSGGAATACIRLHKGLLRSGIDSNLLFMSFSSNRVIENIQVFKLPLKRYSFLNRVLKKLIRVVGLGRNEHDRKIKEQIKKQVPNIIEWFSFPDSKIDISAHPLFQEADIVNIH